MVQPGGGQPVLKVAADDRRSRGDRTSVRWGAYTLFGMLRGAIHSIAIFQGLDT